MSSPAHATRPGRFSIGTVPGLQSSASRFNVLLVAPPDHPPDEILGALRGLRVSVQTSTTSRVLSLPDGTVAEYDAAIIDVDAGDGACDLILQLNEAPNPCRSILLGSAIDRATVREAFLVGVMACLRKPVQAPALMSAVRRAAEATALMRRCIEAVEDNAQMAPLAAPAAELSGLTPREREILSLLLEGGSTRKMSERLGVSERTIKFHVSNLLRKFGAGSRISLLAKLRQAIW